MIAAAPSLMPEALPAVMVPGLRTIGLSFAKSSSVVPGRRCSSLSTAIGPALPPGDCTGTISSAKNPAACAFAARCCERSANASCSLRATWNSSATFSPVSAMESTPYCAFKSGLMKRQPSVVSKTSAWRENAASALPMTDRARGVAHRIEPRRAQPVDGDAGNRRRQAGKQQRHAGDVAVVLAGLIGAAEKDLVEPRPVGLGVARDQRPDGNGGEVIGAHLGERAAVAADRGARRIAEEHIAHRALLHRCFRAIYGARPTGSNGAVIPHPEVAAQRAALEGRGRSAAASPFEARGACHR